MKKLISWVLVSLLTVAIALFAVGCGGDGNVSGNDTSSKVDTVSKPEQKDNVLGDFAVDIKSARMAEDYEGKPVIIITYGFTNNGDEEAAMYTSLTDKVYQDGVECEQAFVLDDSANYNSDNQTKSIKKGVSLDVDIAYKLNNTESPVEVEVTEWISFSDKKITKTFEIK